MSPAHQEFAILILELNARVIARAISFGTVFFKGFRVIL
jgi:hypothetical protein